MQRYVVRFLLAALFAFSVAACGGNDDGSSGSGEPASGDPDSGDPVTGDPGTDDPGTGDPGDGDPGGGDDSQLGLTLSVEQANDVAAFAVTLARVSSALSDEFDIVGGAGGGGDSDSTSLSAAAYSTLAQRQLAGSCEGGSANVTWDDADEDNVPSVGDSFTLVADDCVEGELTSDGQVVIAVPSETRTTVEFTDYSQAREEGNTLVWNGRYQFDTASTESGTLVTATGSQLSIEVNGRRWAISDYQVEHAKMTASDAYETDFSVTVAADDLGGSATVETTRTLQGNGESYPYAGKIVIKGAGGTSAGVNVSDAVNVTLRVDHDGDGARTLVRQTTWEALDLFQAPQVSLSEQG